jgi:hypothetical protein
MIVGVILLLPAVLFPVGLVCEWFINTEPDRYKLLIGAAANLLLYGVSGSLLLVFGRRARNRRRQQQLSEDRLRQQQAEYEEKLQRTEYERRLAEAELGKLRVESELQRLALEEKRRRDEKAGQLGISTLELERIEEQEREEAKRLAHERFEAVEKERGSGKTEDVAGPQATTYDITGGTTSIKQGTLKCPKCGMQISGQIPEMGICICAGCMAVLNIDNYRISS